MSKKVLCQPSHSHGGRLENAGEASCSRQGQVFSRLEERRHAPLGSGVGGDLYSQWLHLEEMWGPAGQASVRVGDEAFGRRGHGGRGSHIIVHPIRTQQRAGVGVGELPDPDFHNLELSGLW